MIGQRIIYCILSVFILLSCACQSQLPKDIPNNLEMRYEDQRGEKLYENGPPAGLFRRATISGNQLTVEMMRCPKVVKVTLTDQEIKGFYNHFVKSEFDLIEDQLSAKNGEEEFKEIHLQAGNITKKVRQGKQFPLSEKSTSRFNGLWTNMLDLAFEKTPSC